MKTENFQWRQGALVSLVWIFFCISLPFFTAGSLRAEERDIILEESGIHYPGGFDSNTVGEVRGKAFNFSRPKKGPVRFQLISDRKTYTILTSPPWYWNEIRTRISEGTEVIVRGSKSFGKDGNLYIVAQEVVTPSSGQSFLFRRKDGTPFWKGASWTGNEPSGRFGPSSEERGGFGGGSRGRGRR